MRIVHIVNYFDPRLGYAEYYLSKKQQELGHEVCVISSDRFVQSPKERSYQVGVCKEEGIKVFRMPSLVDSFGVVMVCGLKDALAGFLPDIVHVHDIFSPLLLSSLLSKNMLGYKVVADSLTGSFIAKGLTFAVKNLMLNVFKIVALPFVLRKVDRFFTNSEYANTWTISELGVDPNQIDFIPLAADHNLFKFDMFERRRIRSQLNVGEDEVLTIYAGKIVPHKKIEVLLRATSPLIRKRRGVKILLLGNGPEKYVQRLLNFTYELKISENVIWHNAVHRTQLPYFYSAADIGVWPGHHSITIIEAMSTGLPVIIPRSKWMNHLLEYKNGFSYTEGNTEELRAHIERLIENTKLRQDMGNRSRELVEDKLNWNLIAARTLKIYSELIENWGTCA